MAVVLFFGILAFDRIVVSVARTDLFRQDPRKKGQAHENPRAGGPLALLLAVPFGLGPAWRWAGARLRG